MNKASGRVVLNEPGASSAHEVPGHFTLHVRLTRRCNANCSYCSSASEIKRYMRPAEYERALLFVLDVLRSPNFGLDLARTTLTIQYVGGEVLTIPRNEIADLVMTGRRIFDQEVLELIDGAQSNLIAPTGKVVFLHTLLGNRISTSVDNFTGRRLLAGSPDKYARLLQDSIDVLKYRRRFTPPAIVVVDRQSLPFLRDEIRRADSCGYALRLRPVFLGASPVDMADPNEIADEFSLLAKEWLMRGRVPIDPFLEMLEARVSEYQGKLCGTKNGCPFSDSCSGRSLDLEPNGDLYLCLDMADAGRYLLGNALAGVFDWGAHALLGTRKSRLPSECGSCRWRGSCHGGCMAEAVAATGTIDGKTPLCAVWKKVFAVIDDAIEEYGIDRVKNWIATLK